MVLLGQQTTVMTRKLSSTKEVTSSHYETHSKAETYEKYSFFYESGAYMDYLATLIRDRLKLESSSSSSSPSRCILDVGGGTGNFARFLLDRQTTFGDHGTVFVVVDPFLIPADSTEWKGSKDGEGSDGSSRSPRRRLCFVTAPAEDFMRAPSPLEGDRCWRTNIIDREFGGYDQILLKEVVHHFEKKDRVEIFRGMREGLRRRSSSSATAAPTPNTTKAPSLLIVTRPQTDIDYPMWDDARAVWKENQPSIEEIEEELREAGYTHLERTVECYPCSISLASWQCMIRNRFWSTFSNFTDEELEQACESIARNYAATTTTTTTTTGNQENDPILHFEDRMIFLTAS